MAIKRVAGKCSTCEHVRIKFNNASALECHRFPPLTLSAWPTVNAAIGWCAEYRDDGRGVDVPLEGLHG